VSFFFLLSKLLGTGLIFYLVLPALAAVLYVVRRSTLRIALEGPPREAAWALIVSALASLPVWIMGWRMGWGEFPAVFFAADSPFFLQQVYALMRTDSYPPPSLEMLGFSFNYHYGIQAFAALASVLTDVKPHFTLFAVIEPLLELLTGLLVYDICRRLTGRHGLALACLVLFLFGSRQYLVNYFGAAGWEFITRAEHFNFRFPNPPNVAGLLVALCAVRCALDFERRSMRMAALFFMCMLPVFKIPYLIPISAGLAFVYLYELRERFRPGLLPEIAGAALLSTLCYLIFAMSPATTRATAEFKVLGFVEMSLPWQNETLLILSVLAVLAAAATRQGLSESMRRLLIVALAPYLLFALCEVEIKNQEQIFDLGIRLVGLSAFVYLASAWAARDGHSPAMRAVAAALLIGLTAPGLLSWATHVHVVTAHPDRGHEFTDNRSLAEALRRVPLDDTLLVTNDLRYPANHFLRDFRQFQLAGLFGHRNLASNLAYGGLKPEEVARFVGITRSFQWKSWPEDQISHLRRTYPVTHLLIHKNYPHADAIPLQLVYENRDYAVYRF